MQQQQRLLSPTLRPTKPALVSAPRLELVGTRRSPIHAQRAINRSAPQFISPNDFNLPPEDWKNQQGKETNLIRSTTVVLFNGTY
jgi:hypothetical protein